jgi:hypothetical protein
LAGRGVTSPLIGHTIARRLRDANQCACEHFAIAFAEICAFDMNRWPNVARWADSMKALPGFKAPFDLLQMQDAELS